MAAPTGGLHFTPGILDALEKRGVERAAITLHVGYGTFQPVRGDQVERHTLDRERFSISEDAADAINRAKQESRRIIAVGTTTTRALELRGEPDVASSPSVRLDRSLHLPRVRFPDRRWVDDELPSPQVVAAHAGVRVRGTREAVLAAYRDAIERQYRFYSYGDAMLILPIV